MDTTKLRLRIFARCAVTVAVMCILCVVGQLAGYTTYRALAGKPVNTLQYAKQQLPYIAGIGLLLWGVLTATSYCMVCSQLGVKAAILSKR